MDVQADAWDFLRARDLVDDADAAEASGAGVLLTDEAREVKLENGLLFAQILKHYDVRCRPSRPASLFLRARESRIRWSRTSTEYVVLYGDMALLVRGAAPGSSG